MARQTEREIDRKTEIKGEGERGKGGKINCCFIMFSSDMTLTVIMVGLEL